MRLSSSFFRVPLPAYPASLLTAFQGGGLGGWSKAEALLINADSCGSAGLLPKISKPTAWRGGAQILK